MAVVLGKLSVSDGDGHFEFLMNSMAVVELRIERFILICHPYL